MMNFDSLFKVFSYTAVLCGFLALWISGSLGVVESGVFVAAMVLAWKIEGTSRQISERPATALIVLAIPLYFIAWRFGVFGLSSTTSALPAFLARLILTLSVIKLLQRKSDRDWVFLYLMGFFQVLLAAGLSISALYLAVFVGYIFVMVCSVILLEMRRTSQQIVKDSSGRITPNESASGRQIQTARIPITALGLLLLIAAVAGPMFFLIPRVGGANGSGNGLGGVSTYSGFSDKVRLGQIGRIQASDEVVMRVRLESPPVEPTAIRWRGVALDSFDNQSWSKSSSGVCPGQGRPGHDPG